MADTVIVTTSVPAATFSDIGLSVPDEKDILDGRLSDLDDALGGGMSKSLTTPQGQIAMSETAIIADKNDQLLSIVNGINPDYSTGRFQDAIGRIYFIDRIAAQGTTVTATATGLVGTVIPAGSTAQDDAGYIYSSLADATIPASGAVDIVFQNQTTGAISCPIGSLNTIYRAVNGWSGITNAAAGVLGNAVESRANFEYRRKQSVALNAKGTPESIYAAVLDVDGVADAYVWSNHTGATINIGSTNYPVPAHSVYIAVYGGEPADIAQAIYVKNQAACGMVGNTSAVVTDTSRGTNISPQYTITWNTPTQTRTYFKVQLENVSTLPSDIIAQAQDAIISAFNGNSDLVSKARIASKVFAGGYYSVLNNIDTASVNVLSVTVSIDGTNYGTSVEYGVDQIPSLDANDISVTLV
ncbi:baseplate J/gp47 family protein [Pantoea sp. EABMAA-21]|uniref:baseplate J/gp47 family protein n=1 Tax=Pantoea sp. EABMAA-21 TaxID=3043302 RepID=UPI0024B48B35|nr:baseplate J/gp47 family protein [Pantoea sp. EABMAA-21]MDI9276157.1 baseplate J/gp47 family protein [Pantoea sp. EABMAA-21]